MSLEKESSPESLKLSHEESPYKESFLQRIKEIAKNEDAKEGLKATGRLFANVGISIVDAVPAAGEVVSLAADAGKFVRGFDLTPDVSKKVALGSELLEPIGFGAVPTHAIETLAQARADFKSGKFEQAKNAIGYLVTGKENYLAELEENRPKLDDAAAQFT